MPIEKQSLNNFLPNGFETLNQEGYKENFNEEKIKTGYERDVPDIVSGPNLNNFIDKTGKNFNTLNKYVAYLNDMPINNIPITDSSNKLNYTKIKTINNNSILGEGNININALPSQAGNSGKFLTTNGSTASWKDVSSYHPPILSTMWSDHLINDMSWLRADTFSWQDGNTYSLVYNELLSEYNNSESVEETEGSITFKRTPKGYKIALATQETAILNKYNSHGIAWYYILDTTNKKFKLPRAKHPSLVTSTSTAPVVYSQHNGSVGQQQAVLPVFNNADHSKIYYTRPYINNGASNQGIISSAVTDTLPPDAVTLYEVDLSTNVKDYNMYLYFYVGAFTKSAEAQTAGLNSELLNGKQDVCIHIIDTYVNGTSGYRIWSDGYCEQWGQGKVISSGYYMRVNFIKPFANTNYIGYGIALSSVENIDVLNYVGIQAKKVNGCTFIGSTHASRQTNMSMLWKVEGYIA